MTRTIAALCLVIAFLTTLTGTASARAVNALGNRVGVFDSNPIIDAYAAAPQAIEPHRENTVSVYDPATGAWLYVNQNPWTFYDPHGLFLDTLVDVGFLAYDAGRMVKNVAEGGYELAMTGFHKAVGDDLAASRHWSAAKKDGGELLSAGVDGLMDGGATLVPFLPAGTQHIDDAYRAVKAADRAKDASKAGKVTNEGVEVVVDNSAKRNVEDVAHATENVGLSSGTKSRFGTENSKALAEFDSVTGKISYNRANIRAEAAANGTTWRHEARASAYHEHGHKLMNPVNNAVKKLFGLSNQPYFISKKWMRAEEKAVEFYGQVRARLRTVMRASK